jgi:hypothetical protein
MKDNAAHTESDIGARRNIVALAKSMLSGELQYIEGADRICKLRAQFHESLIQDEDIMAFVLISSETDHLPLQAQRHLWSPAALANLESDFERVQAWAETFAPQACKNLIARFSNG